MEMDLGRRRRLMLMTLGIVLALVAGLAAFLLAQGQQGPPQVETQAVLVAAREIPARTTVTADDFTVRQLPKDVVLGVAYTDSSLVIGRINSVPIYTGQQVTPNLFATAAADAVFSILEADEVVTPDSPFWRAVGVLIPDNRAVGGEIKAGQRVDLFISVDIQVLALDADGNYQVVDTATQDGLVTGKSTKITIQDLLVLKADPEQEMYILKVDLHQAEQIYHVTQLAPDSFSLALRPEQDTRTADATEFGETTDRIIMRYLYPVPQLVDLEVLIGGPITTLPPSSPGPGTSPEPTETPEN